MLECWQEEPGKRPTFSKLRARFDSMLLAEKKDTYIDLQIDASKPYYNPDLSSDSHPMKQDSLLHVGKMNGSRLSATSPFHSRGITPSHSDFFESSVTPGGQRSPRSVSPVPMAEKLPRSNSLELTTNRRNVYVDEPSAHHSNSPVILRVQRSPPRDDTPFPLGVMLPRPASLQLVSERKNVYVDSPSATRRSVHISPPEWSTGGGGASNGSIPVQVGINLDGASESGMAVGSSDGPGEEERPTVPTILVSLT